MPPTLANGKICYLEIPALEPRKAADFYHAVFRWEVRLRGDLLDPTKSAVGGGLGNGLPAVKRRRGRVPTPAVIIRSVRTTGSISATGMAVLPSSIFRI